MTSAKLLLPAPPFLHLPSLSKHFPSQLQQHPWRRFNNNNMKMKHIQAFLHEETAATLAPPLYAIAVAAADTAGGYSNASYYTSLGLFVISVPGVWSLIKRSVKSKVVQKTFVEEQGKAPSQVAGEIMSFFTRNNFLVADKGETITFEGNMVPSRGQAALLTFCTCISLASVALVLTITVPDVGNTWFALTLLGPLA